jgi:predicted  nucleic acid-binding Zn-ribbon protein
MEKIDKFYLEEARRIRMEYLKNLNEINSRVPFIEKFKQKILSYQDKIKNIVNSDKSDSIKETIFLSEVESLSNDIETLEKEIKPFYNNIKKLSDDSLKLKEAIEQKYIGITIDEIKNQIIPYVSDLN